MILENSTMKKRALIVAVLTILMAASHLCFPLRSGPMIAKAQNNPPELLDPSAYFYEGEIHFSVTYRDEDGDAGAVSIYIEDNAGQSMLSGDGNPSEGQYFWLELPDTGIDDNTQFYFSADDGSGNTVFLKDEDGYAFLVGDFDGWGDPPILSEADVYFDDDDWVFNVTYRDVDGDTGEVRLFIGDEAHLMQTSDPDPLTGQNFVVHVLESKVNTSTRFYFEADDEMGSWTSLYDTDGYPFVVSDFMGEDGTGNDVVNGEDGIAISEAWLEPEVLVGIIGLVALGGGSAYGVWRRKKKRGRFSELLTKLDDIYLSFKTNPHKCEIELEKMRGEINEDLKSNVIDENNYSILKQRLDEIISEIRSESLHSQVTDIPKEIELRIKDMLIDGKISRAEYDKLLPIITGSDMASSDKEKMQQIVESWMVDEKKKAGK
ncbi:MAG: hypothetical protein JSW28_05665 [Thermoplasmata archaeon]|nr:MAG: hypothetical protein JSW28_05665 [Thermoplasmata archaeon]